MVSKYTAKITLEVPVDILCDWTEEEGSARAKNQLKNHSNLMVCGDIGDTLHYCIVTEMKVFNTSDEDNWEEVK